MKHCLKFIYGASLAMLLMGCIDDKYDLANIDTTSEFKVNDLVLPLNLDPVVLSDIIKIKEGDELKEVSINGNTFYAVEQTGEFKSDGVDVNPFSVVPDPLSDKTATFTPSSGDESYKKNSSADPSSLYLLAKPVNEDIEYEAEGIDEAVRDLTTIYFDEMTLKMTIEAPKLPEGISSSMSNVALTIPKGLTISSITAGDKKYDNSAYKPNTGKLNLEEKFNLVDNKGSIEIKAVAIDLSSYPEVFSYDEQKKEGKVSLQSEFNLDSANLNLDLSSSPDEIEYEVKYEIGTLNATSIMGSIEYDLSGTGLNIEPINLGNMPTFLEDPETDLKLSNPQIYLQLKNPIGKYGLGYQSSLDIISIRENDEQNFPSPEIKVPATTGDYNFVLAPYPDAITNIPEEYSNPDRLTYEGLGNILSGNGLPEKLDIKLIDPMIPEKETTSPFELGQSIEGMEGNYRFLAPLSLAEGSRIVKVVDGWWSEDLSDLYIDYLTIMADATNGLSTGVVLNVFAINQDGKEISTTGSIKLDENADSKIELTLEGLNGEPFNNLDGVKIYVIAGENEGNPLAPDQVITLENLKAKVTGNYIREL